MTVCVAALCRDPERGQFVIGASDRKITWEVEGVGAVESEPDDSKIVRFTNAIGLMWAGHSSLQEEILKNLATEVVGRVAAEPDRWWGVQEVAERYAHYHQVARDSRAERQVLAKYFLSRDDFVQRQRDLNNDIVSAIKIELDTFRIPSVEVIVFGIDPTGAHIYVVRDGDISCDDKSGFAAIGVGAWHAMSRFVSANHGPSKPLDETLLLTYFAKRRAEAAIGVGEATNMTMFSAALPFYHREIDDASDVGKTLGKTYVAAMRAERRAATTANKAIAKYLSHSPNLEPQPPKQKAEVTLGSMSINIKGAGMLMVANAPTVLIKNNDGS